MKIVVAIDTTDSYGTLIPCRYAAGLLNDETPCLLLTCPTPGLLIDSQSWKRLERQWHEPKGK